MRLYLVRHGKAEKKSPTGRDEDRPLQPRGERQSRWLGETLSRLSGGDRPALIVSSPAVRAHQTAQLVREILGAEMRLDPVLQLGSHAEDVLVWLGDLATRPEPPHGALMLIGHNPTMEILLSTLIPEIPEEQSEMRTGMAAVIELPAGTSVEGKGTLIGRMRYPD